MIPGMILQVFKLAKLAAAPGDQIIFETSNFHRFSPAQDGTVLPSTDLFHAKIYGSFIFLGVTILYIYIYPDVFPTVSPCVHGHPPFCR